MPKKNMAPHRVDTGKSKRFMGLPHCVLDSVAYVDLTPMERAILVEIVRVFDGRNNGRITLSYKQLAARLGRKNEAPFSRAIGRLISHGFLELSVEAVWQERRAREYRLTFANTSDRIGRPIAATNEYRAWTPPAKIDATDGVATGRKSATWSIVTSRSPDTNGVAVTRVRPS